MLEDILGKLDAVREEIIDYDVSLRTLINNAIPFAEEALLDEFINQFVEAATSTPEYGNAHAAPLIERLIENLSKEDGEGFAHVKVYPNTEVFIFDEEVAGTENDFESARHFSQRNYKNQDLRYIFWKYGIYVPSVEGGNVQTDNPWMRKAMERLPSYDEVIQERLEIWGDKAPYWWFIENGNAGNGKPYPSFPGTHIIATFRWQAQKATRIFFEDLIDEFEAEFLKSVDQAIEEGRPIPLLDDNVRLEKASNRGRQQIIRRGEHGRFVKKLR